jgi:hypothetical protein
MAHPLTFPGAVIAGEFMDKVNWRPGAGLFVIQVHAVGVLILGIADRAGWWAGNHQHASQSSRPPANTLDTQNEGPPVAWRPDQLALS